jgi:cold shock CspA family protein
MGRSQETYSKKENEKKKIQKRKDKEERRQERKANSNKGKSFEDMLAYVDENGQLTSTPPDPSKRKELSLENIQLGARIETPAEAAERFRTGMIVSYNDQKGYGFIRDLQSQESVFFHVNGLLEEVKEGNKVTFETEQGKKGLNAIRVQLKKD